MDREQAKHICMELTADGARVTNLSLSGNRLVLTIEAQLSDSQLKASDQAIRQAAAGSESGEPRPGSSQVRSDTEFLDRERAAGREVPPGGSEALPPAPSGQASSVAFQPGQTYPIGSDTIRRENIGDAMSVNLTDFQKGMDDTDEIHHGGFRSHDVMAGSTASHADTQPIVFEHNVNHHGAPVAPPLEPVRELTDTWDVTHDATTTDGVFQKHAEKSRQPEPPAPVIPPMTPELPPAPAPTAAHAPTPPPVPPTPAPAPTPAPMAPPSPPAITLGDDPLPPAWGAGPLPTPFAEEPKPLTETWDGSEIGLSDMPQFNDNQPAISEESAAFGGARHGEPQPTLSFGGPAAGAPAPAPAPTIPAWSEPSAADAPSPFGQASDSAANPASAPAAAPGLGLGFDFAGPGTGPAGPAEPSSPPPIADMAFGPGFDFAPPPAGATPTPGPAVSIGLEPAPPPLSAEPAPAEAPAPAVPPLTMSDDHLRPGSEDKTVVGPSPFARDAEKLSIPPSMTPPEPATPAASMAQPSVGPAPTPTPTPGPGAETAKDQIAGGDNKTEPGGTTVLIRYTCPKCKTQGMQAVDKVGTVVNCSNCGKAMRLVMKK